MINHDIAVIGGGPAGMAAAVAAYDSGVTDVCILEREEMLGGILKQCIHNGFGLHKLGRELTGPEYAAVYAEKVKERGIKTYCETMVTDISSDKTVTAQSTAGLLKIKAKAIILAMGCRERSRGALNTAGTRPAGVYSAGTAQKLLKLRLKRHGRLFRRLLRGRCGARARCSARRHDAAPDILRLFAVHRIHKIPPSVHFMKAVFRACADGSNCFKKMPETPSNLVEKIL